MAEVHRTTLSPTKTELLAAWLPSQPWYVGKDRDPQLSKVGGFRLDDPDGEVGIELFVAADTSGDTAAYYLVPMTYRGAPLTGGEQGLIGIAEHGVLGRRWFYNGVHDPAFVQQLLALLQHAAEPQSQNESSTPDATVIVSGSAGASQMAALSSVVSETDGATRVVVAARVAGDAAERDVTIDVSRVLRADDAVQADDLAAVHGSWQAVDGTTSRGRFATIAAVA